MLRVHTHLIQGIDHLDTAVIDEDLIGGAFVEETDGDQHISSMTSFELAQVKSARRSVQTDYCAVLGGECKILLCTGKLIVPPFE